MLVQGAFTRCTFSARCSKRFPLLAKIALHFSSTLILIPRESCIGETLLHTNITKRGVLI